MRTSIEHFNGLECADIDLYFSFFLGLRLGLWPQDFFLQLVARGWSLA